MFFMIFPYFLYGNFFLTKKAERAMLREYPFAQADRIIEVCHICPQTSIYSTKKGAHGIKRIHRKAGRRSCSAFQTSRRKHTMRMITFTKKKIKRLTVIGLLAAATAAAGIGAIVTSVGTQASERLIPIYCVERGDKKISLTFDVAWENSNTQELIDILDEYDARATFFVTGDWCDRYPDDVKAFADAGHEIQNHSDQHPHVKGMNVNDLISDTKSASLKIQDITGTQPTLYRAPYGEYDNSLMTTVEGMGMKVIQWDVEALDTDGKPLPEPVQATGAVFSAKRVL